MGFPFQTGVEKMEPKTAIHPQPHPGVRHSLGRATLLTVLGSVQIPSPAAPEVALPATEEGQGGEAVWAARPAGDVRGH